MTERPHRLIRVFPRRTKATPDDALAYFDHRRSGRSALPDIFAEADEVHVDCTFTWDRQKAEMLAKAWSVVAPVKVGGVAYGDRGAEFVPGRYIRDGYIFTSRGCPRACEFCAVRLTKTRLLPIVPGWNVLDDNLLATPRHHIEAVIAMLKQQRRRIHFTGGLEAKSCKDWHINLLAQLKPVPAQFWAYDPGDSYDDLRRVAGWLKEAGLIDKGNRCGCYCLIGYDLPIAGKDTLEAAEKRLQSMKDLGFTPFAMLWKPTEASEQYEPSQDWKNLRRRWIRPAIIHAKSVNPFARHETGGR